MRKLLLFTMLSLLPSCCGTLAAPVAKTVAHCKVPVAPETPELDLAVCGDQVCLTPQDAVKMGRYLTQLANIETAIQGCNLVDRVPE